MRAAKYRFFCILAAAISVALTPVLLFGDDEADWQMLKRGGFVILIRHAQAPGFGDPLNFSLDDCATQRNLSDEGRRQALLLGAAFQSRQIPVAEVYSSQWCRCLETARLAFGHYQELPELNSFFETPETRARQTEALLNFLTQRPLNRSNLILVTHQVNITALTDVFPAQGEMIVTTIGAAGLKVVTRITPQG